MSQIEAMREKLKRIREVRQQEEMITDLQNQINNEQEKIKEQRRSRSITGKIIQMFQKKNEY